MGHPRKREIHPPFDQKPPTHETAFRAVFYLPSPLCSDFDGC
jgi:hypothetical protein